jgi:two-component system nitrate/nitrite response regulator NarL
MTLSALVVEDDDLTRLSLAAALESAGLVVVATAKTSAEAIDLAKIHFPDVALLDVHLGRGPSGVDVGHELRKIDPRVGIVFLSTFEDPRLIAETRPLPEGSQYLLKKDVASIQHITVAIDASREGKNRRGAAQRAGLLSALSDIQLETLRLVAQGLSNVEISRRRHVTEKSIEAIISRLAKTLGVFKNEGTNQRVHLARLYFESVGLPVDDE